MADFESSKNILDYNKPIVLHKRSLYDVKLENGTTVTIPNTSQDNWIDYSPENYSDDYILMHTPKNWIPIEFEPKVDLLTLEEQREFTNKLIRETEEALKGLGVPYCVCDHGGKSPYIHVCNIKEMPVNFLCRTAKEYFLENVLSNEAKEFLDYSNLDKHFIPIPQNKHWKSKYNGAKHKIIRGTNPTKQSWKYPSTWLTIIKKSYETVSNFRNEEFSENTDWFGKFFVWASKHDKFPIGGRHDVIEKNMAIYYYGNPLGDEIIKEWSKNQRGGLDSVHSWDSEIRKGKFTKVNKGEILNWIKNFNIVLPEELKYQKVVVPSVSINVEMEEMIRELGLNPLGGIIDFLNLSHIGTIKERKTMITGFLYTLKALTIGEGGILKITGQSSSGKSHMANSFLKCFPPEWILSIGDLSAESLKWLDWEGEHKGVKILYIKEASGMDKATEKIKLMNADDGGFDAYVTMGSPSEGFKTKKVHIPVKFILTTRATGIFEQQMDNRMFSLSIDETEVQTFNIMIQRSINRSGHSFKGDAKYIQEYLRRLKSFDEVTVPFASALINIMKTEKIRVRRDIDKLYDLCCVNAYLNQNKRPNYELEGKSILFAVPEDAYNVFAISLPSFEETTTGMTAGLKNCYSAIPEDYERTITYRELASKLGVTKTTVSALVKSLEDKNLININTDKQTHLISRCEELDILQKDFESIKMEILYYTLLEMAFLEEKIAEVAKKDATAKSQTPQTKNVEIEWLDINRKVNRKVESLWLDTYNSYNRKADRKETANLFSLFYKFEDFKNIQNGPEIKKNVIIKHFLGGYFAVDFAVDFNACNTVESEKRTISCKIVKRLGLRLESESMNVDINLDVPAQAVCEFSGLAFKPRKVVEKPNDEIVFET